jgi:hypothetical protein
MIVLLNNNQMVLDKITQLHKDTRLNQNEFVSVNKLDWFLVKEKQHYIYKLNNIIKYVDKELNILLCFKIKQYITNLALKQPHIVSH